MFSWRRKAPRERRSRKHLGGSGGMLPLEIFNIEYSETPFSAFLEPRKQFPRRRSLKFSLKSNLLNENGQLVGGGGGRMATTEFSLAYHCEKVAYPLHSFNSLTNTSCVFYLGISLKTWPSRNENEIVTSIPFK